MASIGHQSLTFPEHIAFTEKIGKNTIKRYAETKRKSKVRLFEHGSKSVEILDPFDRKMLLLLKGSRANKDEYQFVLKAPSIETSNDLDESVALKWVKHPLSGEFSRDQINDQLKSSFRIIEEDLDSGVAGLRTPQVGAIHAIASHWTISDNPALVVLPTGTGKTEVMLSCFANGVNKALLVVVPSDSLRTQISNKFFQMGILKELGVLEKDAVLPRVCVLKHGISSSNEADEIVNQSNVIIATASALSKSTDDIKRHLAAGCSALFIDESHHVPATTWTAVAQTFRGKKTVLFTATPFRRDGKRIDARIIYNYRLGLAQSNGYFKPISLFKLNELDGNQVDQKVAQKALGVLKSDLQNGFDHLVMARVNSIQRAETVLEIYRNIAGNHSPQLVHNQISKTEQKEILRQLIEGETRIIVCVNMLGEGFDLPKLKIAAIHDVHKNLTTTLQFIGRFTRTSSEPIGDATAIVNIADIDMEKRVLELYSEDPDWNKIIRQASEGVIQREVDLQELIEAFQGELGDHVSLWNLRPSFSALCFQTNQDNWTPDQFRGVIPPTFEMWSAINHDEDVLVIVVSRESEVKWGRFKDIHELKFDLIVAFWDRDNSRLFIGCSDYDVINPSKLAVELCGQEIIPLHGMSLFNLFTRMDHPMVRNLGASKTGSISFTMYFGPEVTNGLSEIDRANSTPNNIFAWGYEDGDLATYGCSQRSGKIWSQGGGTILDWKAWCEKVGEQLVGPGEFNEEDVPDIIRGFLRPVSMNGRHNSVAVSVEWGEGILKTFEDRVYISFDNVERNLFDVELTIDQYSATEPILIKISSDLGSSVYRVQHIHTAGMEIGEFRQEHISGPVVSIRKGSGQSKDLIDYLLKDPLIIRYADGSFSYDNFHVHTPIPEHNYDVTSLEAWQWNANIKIESEGKEINQESIQYEVIENVIDNYDVVINDDNAYEAGDIIAIKKIGNEKIELHLMHCKFSHSDEPGGRIDNLYELCGQAQKCIYWKHRGMAALENHIKRREKKWSDEGYTRFRKGDLLELRKLVRFSEKAELEFQVSIYQPGLSKGSVTEEILQLLAATDNYVLKTSGAVLKVVCSE